MKSNTQDRQQAGKIVAVKIGRNERDKELFFLFTANQVEDVLAFVSLQAIPFAPHFLLGVCCWRNFILPVLDLKQRCTNELTSDLEKTRYLVVRTGKSVGQGPDKLLRCVVRVPANVNTMEIPLNSVTCPDAEQHFDQHLIRGAYNINDQIYFFPDLLTILQDQQSIDIFLKE